MTTCISAMPLILAAAAALAGCASAPRQQVRSDTPVAQGAGTTQQARAVFEGQWTLIGLEVSTDNGRRATIDASGELTADAFGNLNVEYRLTDAGRAALKGLGIDQPNPVISTSGRVVINTQERSITYLPPDAAARAFDPTLAAARANPFALERTRYYALGADGILTLATRHDNGQDAAVGRWRRQPQ